MYTHVTLPLCICTQTLGGTNSSLYSAGKGMYYTSIVEERFFSVLLTKIAVEDKTINLPCKEVCILTIQTKLCSRAVFFCEVQ